jgi:hypothetical protein
MRQIQALFFWLGHCVQKKAQPLQFSPSYALYNAF